MFKSQCKIKEWRSSFHFNEGLSRTCIKGHNSGALASDSRPTSLRQNKDILTYSQRCGKSKHKHGYSISVGAIHHCAATNCRHNGLRNTLSCVLDDT